MTNRKNDRRTSTSRWLSTSILLASLTLAAGACGPRLSNAVAEVSDRMARQHPALTECYRKARARDANAAGQATVDLTIGRNGRVSDVSLAHSSYVGDDAMQRCVLSAVRGIGFINARPSKPIKVTHRIDFRPSS